MQNTTTDLGVIYFLVLDKCIAVFDVIACKIDKVIAGLDIPLQSSVSLGPIRELIQCRQTFIRLTTCPGLIFRKYRSILGPILS